MTWDLRLGSCLDPVSGLASLAADSVDVTITDPPYEAEAHTQQRRQKGIHTIAGLEEYREVNEAPLEFAAITPEERVAVSTHIARVTRYAALVFCQVEAVAAWRDCLDDVGMTYRRTIPWHKPDAMPSLHGRWPGQSFEALILAIKPGARPCPIGGKAVSYTQTRGSETNRPGQRGAPHPTTKPLRLMRSIVEDFTLPGELVLDCYAGSATTGVACNQLGRNFLGWELDQNYFEIAQRRLRGDEAKPRPEQPSLFGGSL